ncbi:GTP cyclohydrolase I [Bailinhaonella thermotolerans]|uniref:GTP cyclohydrolase 1 n=1 Tax=Bailinhaonella thermotolerans TaxID=1070861 RepID=A0A3A4BB44_9ACTN|nr:GTP cyclohydrolase I [Bailinhaonella thermotolerans]
MDRELRTGRRDFEGAWLHARGLMDALGFPVDSPGMAGTARRLVQALDELTSGMHEDPGRHLLVTFPPEAEKQGMIAVTDIPFISVCEHHLLPFTGTADVAYVPAPGAPVVGLSKLARLVQGYAARPQLQERLGEQIVSAIADRLETSGAACRLRAEHACLTLRGARAAGARMVTIHVKGVFETDAEARAEFVELSS